jgi:hypothetical protein
MTTGASLCRESCAAFDNDQCQWFTFNQVTRSKK